MQKISPQLRSTILANVYCQIIGAVDNEIRFHFGKDGAERWDEENSDLKLHAAIDNALKIALDEK